MRDDRKAFYGEEALAFELTAEVQDAIEDFASLACNDDGLDNEADFEADEIRGEIPFVVAPRSGFHATLGFAGASEGATALLFSRAGLLELMMDAEGRPLGLRVVNPTPDVTPLVEAAFPPLLRRAPTLWDELGMRLATNGTRR